MDRLFTLPPQHPSLSTIHPMRNALASRAKQMTFLLILLLASVSLLPDAAQAQAETDAVLAVRAGQMLDVTQGTLVEDAVIVIRGERIEALGSDVEVPSGAEVIDLSDHVVLPGLIDAHTHICLPPDYDRYNPILHKSIPYRTVEAVDAAGRILQAGFTTIRDVDSEGADWADVAVRDGINDGLIPGPRMQVSTLAISITAGHMNHTGLAPSIDAKVPQYASIADTPDQLVKEVRRQIKHGADWIKLYATGTTRHIDLETLEPLNQYSLEEMKLVVDEAARFGVPVATHAYGGRGAKDAIRAGVRSVEHGILLDEEALDLMVEHGAYWVPTLTTYFPQPPHEEWNERRRAFVDSHKRAFQMALEKDVKIAYGTDAGSLPIRRIAEDLELMVEYGMNPIDAIRTATTTAAELLGWQEDIGSLDAGKYADIIAVEQNPLDNVSALGNVQFVMKGGHVYKQPSGQ